MNDSPKYELLHAIGVLCGGIGLLLAGIALLVIAVRPPVIRTMDARPNLGNLGSMESMQRDADTMKQIFHDPQLPKPLKDSVLDSLQKTPTKDAKTEKTSVPK
jgi:hypothetical protein